MTAAIFPWPSRSERRMRLEYARERAAVGREKTRESEAIVRDLRRISQENHIAQAIVEGIVGEQGKRRGNGA